MKKPLEDIRIVDFSRVLAGPFCTMNLADFGAEVIKVERPVYGDDSRIFGPFLNGESTYWIYVNRGKQSITLDLKQPEAKQIIYDLVKESDVLVENFKPGVMDKLGFSYEKLKEINPGLVYCSISGFGQNSPYRNRLAYDIVAQAMGGMMSITGYPDSPPLKVGSAVGDISAGLYAAFGIMLALFSRSKSGKGQFVDISMVDSIFSLLETNILRYTVGNKIPSRIGSRHPLSAPFDSYQAKDGLVIIAVASDQLFIKLCDVMGKPDLMKDEKYASDPCREVNEASLKVIIEEWLKDYTVAEAVDMMHANGIPVAPIMNIQQLCEDEHIKERKMLVEVEHPKAGKLRIPGNVVKLSETPPEPRLVATQLGQHTIPVLRDILNYDEAVIKDLGEKNII